jgi:alpha-tubulin suppressor-like RCC1 family protein
VIWRNGKRAPLNSILSVAGPAVKSFADNGKFAVAVRNDGSLAQFARFNSLPGPVRAVAACDSYFAFLLEDGSAITRIPSSSRNDVLLSSAERIPPVSNVRAIAACNGYAVVVTNDGKLLDPWKLARPSWLPSIVVPAGLDNVKDVALGSSHALALRNDGTVVACGVK